jgi:hypothetical protein
MQYIGFDIGIRNLAYCIVVVEEPSTKLLIQRVEKVDMNCKKSQHQKLIDTTIEVLDIILHEHLDIANPVTVLIESQMTSVMRCIQTAINTYFKVNARYMDLDLKTQYVSPKLKLNMLNKYASDYTRLQHSSNVSSYKQNKLDAVHFALWLLESSTKFKNVDIKNQLLTSKKPDDECDCLLMTFAYIDAAR